MQDSLIKLALPLEHIFNPHNRIFIGYLATALLMAIWIYHTKSSRQHVTYTKGLLRFLFPKDIWFNRSTALDISLLFLNSWIKIVLFIPLMLSTFSVGFYTIKALNALFGVLDSFPITSTFIFAFMYTATLILSLDFSRYLLHRAMHALPFLWRFHKLHHSAKTMTPLTLYRTHPIEAFLQYARDAAVTGFVSGLFYYISNQTLDMLTLLGINAGRFLFNMAGSNLRHSHIWLSFGRLEHIFISPAQHQIHHSNLKQHYNRNFGSQFAIWDKIFNTLYLTKKRECIEFGLTRTPSARINKQTLNI